MADVTNYDSQYRHALYLGAGAQVFLLAQWVVTGEWMYALLILGTFILSLFVFPLILTAAVDLKWRMLHER